MSVCLELQILFVFSFSVWFFFLMFSMVFGCLILFCVDSFAGVVVVGIVVVVVGIVDGGGGGVGAVCCFFADVLCVYAFVYVFIDVFSFSLMYFPLR